MVITSKVRTRVTRATINGMYPMQIRYGYIYMIHDACYMKIYTYHIYIYMYTLRTYNMIYVYLSINGVMGGYMSICLSSLNLNIRLNLIWTNLI